MRHADAAAGLIRQERLSLFITDFGCFPDTSYHATFSFRCYIDYLRHIHAARARLHFTLGDAASWPAGLH